MQSRDLLAHVGSRQHRVKGVAQRDEFATACEGGRVEAPEEIPVGPLSGCHVAVAGVQ
jgi:hypothetical protein